MKSYHLFLQLTVWVKKGGLLSDSSGGLGEFRDETSKGEKDSSGGLLGEFRDETSKGEKTI